MTKSLIKWLLIVLGILFVGLGSVGIFLPILPTTPFMLLAAGCFLRSSDTLHNWLINHKVFGFYIKQYIEHKAITRKTKIVSLLLLWCTISFSILFALDKIMLRLLLLLIASGVTIHILKMKTLTQYE